MSLATHPALIGPAVLYHLKRGKPVEHITVYITHKTVHHLFQGEVPEMPGLRHGNAVVAKQIRDRCPLEMILAEGMDMEQRIDCRHFEVRWQDIDIRTDEQKQAANRAKSAPAPKPPEDSRGSPDVVHVIADIFEPYHALALQEFRLLQIAVQREKIRQQLRQAKDPPPAQDTVHE